MSSRDVKVGVKVYTHTYTHARAHTHKRTSSFNHKRKPNGLPPLKAQ